MNWSKRTFKLKAKTLLLQVLDKLPANLGFMFYHMIQERWGNESINFKINTTLGSYKILERITSKVGVTIEGKNIIEIGSGWLPLIPYYLIFFGKAKQVKTYDLYKHYRPETIKELNEIFSDKFKEKVKPVNNNKYYLPSGVLYYSQTNIVEEEKICADIIFSRFVLEHITTEDLKLMHKKFKDSLKPGSIIVHLISPGDHRAYDDNSLSLQDFLKYSEEEWNKKQTKFNYHNRLRLPQYLNLFKNLGYEILHLEYNVPGKSSKTYKKFEKLVLHPDYKNYTEEELMAGSINLILRV